MKILLCCCLPLFLISNAGAQVIIIDSFDFSSSLAAFADATVPGDLAGQEAPEIIAPIGEPSGTRLLMATFSGPGGTSPGTYATTAFTHNAGSPPDSYLTMAARSGADSTGPVETQSSLSWGAITNLNQNFASLGTVFEFQLTVTSTSVSGIPGGQIPLTLALANNGGDSMAVTRTITSGGATVITWSSLEFPTIDFTDLDSLELQTRSRLSPNSEYSISFTDFRAVGIPEPHTAVFAILSLGALAPLRRRRQLVGHFS